MCQSAYWGDNIARVKWVNVGVISWSSDFTYMGSLWWGIEWHDESKVSAGNATVDMGQQVKREIKIEDLKNICIPGEYIEVVNLMVWGEETCKLRRAGGVRWEAWLGLFPVLQFRLNSLVNNHCSLLEPCWWILIHWEKRDSLKQCEAAQEFESG